MRYHMIVIRMQYIINIMIILNILQNVFLFNKKIILLNKGELIWKLKIDNEDYMVFG